MEQAEKKLTILVTGSTGAVGKPVCRALRARGHLVRGLARHQSSEADQSFVGDLADAAVVDAAVAGADVVIHLGAYPNDADFLETLLGPNVIGLYHVCAAARRHKVGRLILASSIQVISGKPLASDRLEPLHERATPTNHYALTKQWAEDMGRMYARAYGMAVLAVRIGWLPRTSEEAGRVHKSNHGGGIYLSHGDAGRFFVLAAEATAPAAPGYACVFAASRPSPGSTGVDLSSAQAVLGFEPRDVFPEGLDFPFTM